MHVLESELKICQKDEFRLRQKENSTIHIKSLLIK